MQIYQKLPISFDAVIKLLDCHMGLTFSAALLTALALTNAYAYQWLNLGSCAFCDFGQQIWKTDLAFRQMCLNIVYYLDLKASKKSLPNSSGWKHWNNTVRPFHWFIYCQFSDLLSFFTAQRLTCLRSLSTSPTGVTKLVRLALRSRCRMT